MSPEELWAMDEEENQKRLAKMEFHEIQPFEHKAAADFKFFAQNIDKQAELNNGNVVIHTGKSDDDNDEDDFFDIVTPTKF